MLGLCGSEVTALLLRPAFQVRCASVGCGHASAKVRGQRTTCGNLFSLSILWVLGTKLRLLDLAADILIHGTVLLAHFSVLLLRLSWNRITQ